MRYLDGDRVDLMVKTSGLCHEEWVVGSVRRSLTLPGFRKREENTLRTS